jgi:shikimate kinase
VATDARVLRKADLPPGAFVLEARYGSQTPLACDALARGCRLVDGRRWLLHQGAQAFAHFTGRRPSLTVMSQALTGADRRTGPHLALIGFMGAGKSSVARLVGRRVGLPVVDTDLLVEQRCGTRVAQLLVDRGEEALRRQESAVVRELPRRPSLVSCGGGLVTRAAATAALLARSRLVVWLWAKPETCVGRIAHPRSRPLLGADPLREATRLLAARMGDYASACDVVVDTEGQSLRSVVDQVVCLWREARG